MHGKRRFCVGSVASAAELARKLTAQTWTLCTCFELAGYLFLNDSTCEDGAQEYSVVKRAGPGDRPLQVESITFGWCAEEQALSYIQQAIRGEMDGNDFARSVDLRLETPDKHGRCDYCA